jgi:ABC-2 type transport system permease protein
MFNGSLRMQVVCRWREFRREPSAFYWVLLMPLFWMVVLGAAFSNPSAEKFDIAWQVKTGDKFSQDLLQTVRESKCCVVEEISEDVDSVSSRISLVVKPSENLLEYHYDPVDPSAERARRVVDEVIQKHLGRMDIVPSLKKPFEAMGRRYIDFLVPGLLALTIMSTSLFGIGMTIVANRKENLLKRYMVTPMRPLDYILSHIIGRYISFGLELLVVLGMGGLLYGFSIKGAWLEFLLMGGLGVFAFSAIALGMSARSKSIPFISGTTNLLMILLVMFGGVFFSLSNFPNWLQAVAVYSPMTMLVESLRAIAIDGVSLWDMQPAIIGLLLYGVLAIGFTRVRFRWY